MLIRFNGTLLSSGLQPEVHLVALHASKVYGLKVQQYDVACHTIVLLVW